MDETVLGFRVELNASKLKNRGEPADAITDYRGSILALDQNSQSAGIAGRIEASVIRTNATQWSLYDVLDTSTALMEYSPLLHNNGRDYSTPVRRYLENHVSTSGNLLLLHILEILPQYRGRDWGIQALQTVISRLGTDCGLVALLPFPLQYGIAADRADELWNQEMGYEKFVHDKPTALRKLRQHYGKLGFQPLRGYPLMIGSANYVSELNLARAA
jgi:GNAT superfamily N-acetyltransferase